jgi:hypothetical protein
MATLLLKLQGIRSLNRTIFPPRLYVYDDLLVYKKRSWFVVREITIAYNQIAQVNIKRGLIFADIDMTTSGTDDIKIRWILKGPAKKAKKIIDQKIYHSHANHKQENHKLAKEVTNFEQSINRLRELLHRGQISSKEYKKRKSRLLKKIR